MHNEKMIPVVDPEVMLPRVEKMLYKQAWKFATQYPITFEEAKSEAYLAFMEACYSYKADRGAKFSSWCYHEVWCKLKDLIMSRSSDRLSFVDEVREDALGEVGDFSAQFFEKLEDVKHDLTEDANDILNTLMNVPKELLQGARPPHPGLLMKRTKKYLLANGHEKCNLDQAHQELAFQMRWALRQ